MKYCWPSVWLILLTACYSVPRISGSELSAFFNPVVPVDFKNGMIEYPDLLVPRLFSHAESQNRKLEAIVVTQHGHHPLMYALFIDGIVMVNATSFHSLSDKGTIPYSSNDLPKLIGKLEDEEKCRQWNDETDVQPDLLVYVQESRLRVCVFPYWGGDELLREAFWHLYPPDKIHWLE